MSTSPQSLSPPPSPTSHRTIYLKILERRVQSALMKLTSCDCIHARPSRQLDFEKACDELTGYYLVDLSSPVKQVPDKPLVGIELNPGPKSKKLRAIARQLAQLQLVTQRVPAIRRNKKKKKNVSGRQNMQRLNEKAGSATLEGYVSALQNPFFASPVRLGFGTFVPTSLRAGWFRTSATANALSTCFAVRATPTFTTGNTTTCSSGYGMAWETTTGTVLIGASTATYNQAAVNSAALASVIQTARLVSMALRVTVRYPATAMRGNLFGAFIPDDSGTNFAAQSFNGLCNLFASCSAVASAAGEITIEVQYRPMDASAFIFTSLPTSSYTAATDFPQLYVCGTGWPLGTAGGFSYEVNQISHYESLSGFDGAGEDADGGNTLASNGFTTDQVGQAASKAGQPVVTSGWAVEALDSALSNISRARSGRGRLGRALTSDVGVGISNSAAVLDSQIDPDTKPSLLGVSSSSPPIQQPSSPADGFVKLSL
jgi:hypothetical protein